MGDSAEVWTDGAVTVRVKREGPTTRWSSFEVELPERVEDAWARWTTGEGMQSFFAPKATSDVRVGGLWEALFFPERPPGERGAEGVRFRAIEPGRWFEVQWNAPPQFPSVRKEGFRARVEFTPVGAGKALVRLTLDGFKQGAEWDGTYEYFLMAWPVVLNRCRRACVEGPIDWAALRAG